MHSDVFQTLTTFYTCTYTVFSKSSYIFIFFEYRANDFLIRENHGSFTFPKFAAYKPV